LNLSQRGDVPSKTVPVEGVPRSKEQIQWLVRTQRITAIFPPPNSNESTKMAAYDLIVSKISGGVYRRARDYFAEAEKIRKILKRTKQRLQGSIPKEAFLILNNGWVQDYAALLQIIREHSDNIEHEYMFQYFDQIDRILKSKAPVATRISAIRAHLAISYTSNLTGFEDTVDAWTPTLNMFIIGRLRNQYSKSDWNNIEAKFKSECKSEYNNKYWLKNNQRLYQLMDQQTRIKARRKITQAQTSIKTKQTKTRHSIATAPEQSSSRRENKQLLDKRRLSEKTVKFKPIFGKNE